MSLKHRGNQAISAVAIPLFIGAIIFLTVELGKNSRLQNDVNDGKLTTESLLSEKLLLDKEIARLRKEQQTLTAENRKVNVVIALNSRELDELRRQNQKLTQQSTLSSSLNKQLQQQIKTNNEMERNIEMLNDSVAHLTGQNEDILNLLANSKIDNAILKEIANGRQASIVTNSLTEATKRNKKLTITAAKTQNITLTADVPAESQGLALKVTSPDGRVISSAYGEVAVKVIHVDANNPQAFFVARNSAAGRQYKRIEMTFKPNEKLKSGIYIVEVVDTMTSIGSLQVRLR